MKYVGENALKKWTSLVKSDIKKKLDKNQGTANSGKILGVNASGEVAPTDTEVATLVDVPNGIVKGDGSTLSAAVAGTDYVTPDGMNEAIAEAKPFIVTMNEDNTTNKTVTEIKAAYDAGRTCVLAYSTDLFALVVVNDKIAAFSTAIVTEVSPTNLTRVVTVIVTNGNRATVKSTDCQNMITVTGLLKGDGNGGVSAAVAGTDYMAPVTGGTTGQVLTKTADGQEWQDREKATFIVTLISYTKVDKTVAEIKAAKDAGRICFLRYERELYPLFAVDDTEAIFAQSISSDGKTIVQYMVTVNADGNVSITFTQSQQPIEATGLLKGDGSGGVSAAVAGTDYVTPSDMTSAIQSAIQNTWEASY